KEIIYEIGGGVMDGKKFKAVQTGGPSGGCIPEHLLDTPVDFDTLAKVGSMMGSGGMVVMDEDNCMVDVAKYFLSFCKSESCGKCPPCRIGTYQMLEILEKITTGKGEAGDIEKLTAIGEKVKESALIDHEQCFLCGLCKEACAFDAVKETSRSFFIDQDYCTKCKACYSACPIGAVKVEKQKRKVPVSVNSASKSK
ncbi:MAG: 4Fe-4S binding protein, partial [Nitrospirae bacterium]|nr:4Fe-4S binding protein [Nitrospirota bacterium]